MANVNNSDQEIWKDIPGYENAYKACTDGRVKSLKYGKCLKPTQLKNNYFTVTLYRDKKSDTFMLHRVIAMTFIPNPENKEQVNHINGIKADNRLENLEWCTRSDNMKHAIRTGLAKAPKYNHIAFLKRAS